MLVAMGLGLHDYARPALLVRFIIADTGIRMNPEIAAIHLDFKPEMYLIPLTGHTRGHCGVVVQDGNSWLFHAADALPTNAQFDLLPPWIYKPVIGPHVPRLKAFAEAHPEVRMLAGHMWTDFFEKEQTNDDAHL